MNDKIFISYRRSDTAGTTGRLHDYLSEALGAENVFKDVQDIPAGVKFTEVLRSELEKCNIILVMIGQSYTSIQDEAGNLRLHDPSDFVHLEVATALDSDKIVIPVLVDGATMPSADELPDSLKDLVEYNAVVLSHDRWKSDVDVLLKKLEHHIGPKTQATPGKTAATAATTPPAPARSRKWLVPAMIGAVVLFLAFFLLPGLLEEDDDFEDPAISEASISTADDITTSALPIDYYSLLVGIWGCFQYGDEYQAGANLFMDVYYDDGRVYLGRSDQQLDFELQEDVLTFYQGDDIVLTLVILSIGEDEMELQFANEYGDPIIAKYRKLEETY